MKKKLLVILCMLCTITLTAFFASCGGGDEVTHTLDTSGFNNVVVYNSPIDYSDFVVKSSDGKSISVTSSMVAGWDTSSVGSKTLTILYKEMRVNVDYVVKYEVKFIVDGQTIATQYVLNAGEIQAPSGYTFEIPAQITNNLQLTGSASSTTDVEISIGNLPNDLYVGADAVNLPITVSGTTSWSATTSNDNITVRQMDGMLLLSTNKVGVTELTVSAGGKQESKTVIVKPTSLTINQSTKTYGIENLYTIGRTNVNGEVSKTLLNVSCANVGEGFYENVEWTSNSSKATISNGEITLAQGEGAEIVTFTASFYGVKSTFSVRCVYNGVNVSNYADLYTATKAQKPIVLKGDIAFPTNVNEIKYETVHTTYDDTYYKNINALDKATIKVLLQFKNNVYGNGYEINAHNATLGLLDATGKPTANSLFKGPLDFVALTGAGASLASVKGQDNVCFGVYENVTLNNVILKGANLENDLTELNYAGTTVEVFGNNVTIEYSRIMNGRTVLRVFGDANDPNVVINVNVKNSVLTGAREFIIRMGSNKFVDGIDGNVSPYIAESIDLIGIKKGPDKDGIEKPADYESKYIKTYVNVENSVFKDAGIFAIGIDAHFAGPALHEASGYVSLFEGFKNWKNLAKTSYGAKLTFNGEVKMYNWKKLSEIDSSTLIEMDADLLGETVAEMLNFDIPAMLETAKEKGIYTNIITDSGYIHNAIAFFGGGRNYGLFEDNSNLQLQGVDVSLESVEKGALMTAAGTENFYFRIYDISTTIFTPEMQESMSEADMYDCIFKK